MRQVTRKGLMTVVAATGVIAAAGGAAHADSVASGSGSGSLGVLSGNTVQAPVNVPVNVCGNTVDVVGVLNPSVGNSCANQGGASSDGNGDSGGSQADEQASDSPGVGSGNHVQAPIDVPVNVCGNSVNVAGAENTSTDNDCANEGDDGQPTTPPGGGQETPGQPGNPGDPGTPGTPPASDDEQPGGTPQANQPGAQTVTQPRGTAQLAQTGSDLPMGLLLPVGAGALLAGAVLYRKARNSA
jgi:hypothetical protein